MPELAFYRHGEELLRVAISDRTTIGRAADCDVTLPDPALSRVQAVIERRGDRWWLVDCSGRGTRVGPEAVEEARLEDGAELALGAWRALFRLASLGAGDDGATRHGGATAVRAAGSRRPSQPIDSASAREGASASSISRRTPSPSARSRSTTSSDRDPFVSARHLRLERRGARWRVRDVGSTNGTSSAACASPRPSCRPACRSQLGDTELVLEARDAPTRPRGAVRGHGVAHAALRQLFDLVERVAPSDAAVTILGETGTGKELVARALHRLSGRRERAFIPVNCSAIAESLIESELFGHEKGAFSGAERLRKGAFEEADGGTIFLDEIGELPIDLQPKLLRTLELGEVKRVGASRPLTVNVRVVAATHRDLQAQVRAGKFREDLYYRLCVVPVTIPPLRARRGDVRALAEHFLARAAPRGLALRFSDEALAKLDGYDWPGNVRQLKNVVQRALLFRGEGIVIPASAVTFEDARGAGGAGDDDSLYVRGLTLEDLEREAIRLSLRRHRGKRAAVVKELQIAKSTVMKRIGQWGLQNEGRDPAAVAGEDDE